MSSGFQGQPGQQREALVFKKEKKSIVRKLKQWLSGLLALRLVSDFTPGRE